MFDKKHHGVRASTLVLAAIAATIAACGGGNDSPTFAPLANAPAPAPAPADPPAADQGSGPCTNEADYREGTTVSFKATIADTPGSAAGFQRRSVTGPRESFANANPVGFVLAADVRQSTMTGADPNASITLTTTDVRKEYRELASGKVLIYGDKSVAETVFSNATSGAVGGTTTATTQRTFDPPLAYPANMQPGEVASQRTIRTTTRLTTGVLSAPASTSTDEGRFDLTYQGRERISTPLGTFDSCKFTYQLTAAQSGASLQTSQDTWVAAEGPYRGQLLRQKKSGAIWDVVTLDYSPS